MDSTRSIGDLEVVEDFEGFIEGWKTDDDKYERGLSQVPYTKVFRVDFQDFYLFNPDLALKIIEDPTEYIKKFKEVVEDKLNARKTPAPVDIEITNLPVTTPIRGIDYNQIGQLVQLEGIIMSVAVPEQRMTKTAFQCLHCGDEIVVKQDDQFTQYPSTCPECKHGRFTIIPEHSNFKKIQRISIQESPDIVPPGLLPRRFKITLEERLVESVKPGTRARIIGILHAQQRRKKDQNPVLALYLTANSIDDQSEESTAIQITEEDIKRFKYMATQPNHLERVANSIAPDIYGYPTIKRALALQQCEGVPKMIGGKRRHDAET